MPIAIVMSEVVSGFDVRMQLLQRARQFVQLSQMSRICHKCHICHKCRGAKWQPPSYGGIHLSCLPHNFLPNDYLDSLTQTTNSGRFVRLDEDILLHQYKSHVHFSCTLGAPQFQIQFFIFMGKPHWGSSIEWMPLTGLEDKGNWRKKNTEHSSVVLLLLPPCALLNLKMAEFQWNILCKFSFTN